MIVKLTKIIISNSKKKIQIMIIIIKKIIFGSNLQLEMMNLNLYVI